MSDQSYLPFNPQGPRVAIDTRSSSEGGPGAGADIVYDSAVTGMGEFLIVNPSSAAKAIGFAPGGLAGSAQTAYLKSGFDGPGTFVVSANSSAVFRLPVSIAIGASAFVGGQGGSNFIYVIPGSGQL